MRDERPVKDQQLIGALKSYKRKCENGYKCKETVLSFQLSHASQTLMWNVAQQS